MGTKIFAVLLLFTVVNAYPIYDELDLGEINFDFGLGAINLELEWENTDSEEAREIEQMTQEINQILEMIFEEPEPTTTPKPWTTTEDFIDYANSLNALVKESRRVCDCQLSLDFVISYVEAANLDTIQEKTRFMNEITAVLRNMKEVSEETTTEKIIEVPEEATEKIEVEEDDSEMDNEIDNVNKITRELEEPTVQVYNKVAKPIKYQINDDDGYLNDRPAVEEHFEKKKVAKVELSRSSFNSGGDRTELIDKFLTELDKETGIDNTKYNIQPSYERPRTTTEKSFWAKLFG